MQIQFNRPVTLGEHTYGKGQHKVPEADVNGNWFFDTLVKDGGAVVLRQDVPEEKPAMDVSEAVADAPIEISAFKPRGKKG